MSEEKKKIEIIDGDGSKVKRVSSVEEAGHGPIYTFEDLSKIEVE